MSAAIAWRELLAVGGGLTTLLLVASGRYGYHRDELIGVDNDEQGAPVWLGREPRTLVGPWPELRRLG